MKLQTLIENKVLTLEEANAWCKKYCYSLELQKTEQLGVFDVITSFSLLSSAPDLPFKLRNMLTKGEYFDASYSNITSLENCPRICLGSYYLSGCNHLKSLIGLPKEIHHRVYIDNLKLPLLRLLLVKEITKIISKDDMLDSILMKHYKNGDRSAIVPCQDELIENGYEWAAKL